ncbi:hypothetical protein ACFLRN_05755 [Thermoproteota archaeon]
MKKSVCVLVLLLDLLLILCMVLSTFSFPLVSATEDSWTTLTPMPNARSGLGVLVVTRL